MPNGVVVAGGKIYFAVGGAVSKPSAMSLKRADLDGSNVETVGQKIDVSFDPDLWTSDFAYTTDPQGIAHVATSTGQESTVVDLGWDATGDVGSPVLYALSLDGNDGLFIQSTFDPYHSPQPATLVRWSPSGGAPVTLANGLEVDMNWPARERTASDGTNAYASSAGSIVRAPLTGGALETVGPTAAATGGIAFDDTRVFWTAFDTTSFTLYAACR